ncbi:hypothetical protein A9K55_005292 [Cordyceps militaris]|uniref:Aminoglycoside phosphotransferase domain-containing protein n=1 Tax=Cordyceps militaris TaxID=73501 RepID=A0A2H4SNY3_CORMI|nr:hypothetical protein A9K55_005292 [Cordyceps militaris]
METEPATMQTDPATVETEPATMILTDRPAITYESAVAKEEDMIVKCQDYPETNGLYMKLWDQSDAISALTLHHLGLSGQHSCSVSHPSQWLRGAFNVCIPVQVQQRHGALDLLLRCPMPHKVAEKRLPGTPEEKLATEVATYAWMQDNVPHIRIPHLYGLGFRGGEQFTHSRQRSLVRRVVHEVRRFANRLLGRPTLSNYTLHTSAAALGFDSSYMLLEYVREEQGTMLVSTWMEHKGDPKHRRTLFRNLSKIMLSLASIPQPCIGSFRFNRDGTIALASRPVTASMMVLENGTAPRTMAPDTTYRTAQSYAAAMLDFHDDKFLAQPNAVFDEADCLLQMAVHTSFRLHAYRFIGQDYNHGPFVLQLTDLNAGNIFVDADWNITCLVDLEWTCSLPVEMLSLPHWLTEASIDQICDKGYHAYNEIRREFMAVLAEVERELGNKHSVALSQVMERAWQSDAFWFWSALNSINAMYRLAMDRLSPQLADDKTQEAMALFWPTEARDEVVKRKLEDKERYDDELRCLFEKYNPGKVVNVREPSDAKDNKVDLDETKVDKGEEDATINESEPATDDNGQERNSSESTVDDSTQEKDESGNEEPKCGVDSV